MRISKKLRFIVLLTVVEVSITVFAALQIAKGSTFHRLNYLHVKYNSQFAGVVYGVRNGTPIAFKEVESVILNIKQQPEECIAQVNSLDKVIMWAIDTIAAVDICIKDIQDADNALISLSKFENNEINKTQLVSDLTYALNQFNYNSAQFDPLINKTVSFILKNMIPLVLIISFFNIFLIGYLSRTISNSIQNLTRLLLSKPEESLNLDESLENNTSDELKDLMVAARKRITAELFNLESSKELQAIVDSKTIALRKANEELTQFSYRTSHDLKSPLSSAKSLAQFISMDIDDGDYSEAKNNANKIRTQMEKLENLIVDILLLAQADAASNKQELIDFEVILTDIKERLSWLHQSNPCSIEMNLDLSQEIFLEKMRISQILENLISNSLKYYNKNTPSPYIKIDVFNNDDDLFVTLSDNGIGIPEEHQSELFTMFKRFHPEYNDGTGLGLSIIKKYVDSLNGAITCESSPQGTIFKITLPLDKQNE